MKNWDDLPQHWRVWIENYSKNISGGKHKKPGAGSFSGSIKILFPDDSKVEFMHAFCVKNEERLEVAVFTEHCGYHIFPLSECVIEGTEHCILIWA